ncbi:hypothetical protein GCM10029964_059190 [Kibdelosporangium lantanae]
MRRRHVAVVVVALVAGATPAVADTTNVPGRYTGQALAWHLCTPDELATQPTHGLQGLECATFRTPRDWDRPYGRDDLTIAVSRLRSTGTTTASVFTNPGGPGADGRFFPAEDNFTRQTRLREHQEIIGIDVRGTGKSTNATCDGATDLLKELDARDRDPRNLNHILDTTERVAALCQRALGDLGPVITTYQTVRDLDLLRILLGRNRINWVGYSGGSWLGAHYAQRFPGTPAGSCWTPTPSSPPRGRGRSTGSRSGSSGAGGRTSCRGWPATTPRTTSAPQVTRSGRSTNTSATR